jgi:hypothetical protein
MLKGAEMGWNAWSVFQAVGNIASILGAASVVFVLATCTTLGMVLGYVTVAGIAIVATGQMYRRRLTLTRIERKAMVETGTRLIEEAKEDVLLIAGDMSWAPDYARSIKKLTDQGKTVRVMYPQARAGAPRVRRNMQTLTIAGATLIPVNVDTHLRAMIVDPAHRNDGQLYVVERRLRDKAPKVEEGEPGSGEAYEYVGRLCRLRDEALLASLAVTLRSARV